MKFELKKINIKQIVVMLFLIIAVLLPLIRLIMTINIADFGELVRTPRFAETVTNSIVSTLIATILSVSIALGLSWCINRTNIRYRNVLSVLFTLLMLIPSISHGMGLVLLFGDNGLITNFFGINIGLYGMTGIVLGSILYSFPVAYLMLTDIFRYEDYTTYESAEVLGLTKFQQFMTITLPNLKRPLISSFFAVFTMIFTDYGVPLTVGGKVMTLSTFMYREVIGLLNFSKGAIIGVFLLIPAIIAFIIDLNDKNQSGGSTVSKAFVIKENKKRDVIAYIFCILVLVFIAMPLGVFAILTFVSRYPVDMSFTLNNIKEAFNLGVGSYLLNSLTIALVAALVGTIVSYFTAYLTARSKRTFSNSVLHLISIISLAIPGVVLGLSYVIAFNGSVFYGTLIILAIVNIVHFFASPYLLAYNSLKKFNSNLEDVAQTMGISDMQMMFNVYIPSTQETILEMYSYFFVNAMITISAVSFLANLRTMPLSLLIPQFDSQSLIEATAFISVLILITNILLKAIIYWLKKSLNRKENLNVNVN